MSGNETPPESITGKRGLSIAARILVRVFMASMTLEAMWVLRWRSWLVSHIIGQRPQNLQIFAGVFIENFDGLTLGANVSINRDSNLSCGGGLRIGYNVAIGHRTSIITSNHGFADPTVPIKFQPSILAPVEIGADVWIGANVTILAGVTIPKGTVIAASAVVTRSFDKPDMIIGGVPARIIRSRFA